MTSSGDLPRCTVLQSLFVGAHGAVTLGRIDEGVDAGRLVLLRQVMTVDDSFLAAVENARSLVHPRLLKVLGLVRGPTHLHVASEHAVGVSLFELGAEVVRTGTPLSVLAATRIVLEVARSAGAARNLWTQRGAATDTPTIHTDGVWVASYGDILISELGVLPHLRQSRAKHPSPAEAKTRDLLSASTELFRLLTGQNMTPEASRHLSAVAPPLAQCLEQVFAQPRGFGGLEALIWTLERLPSTLLGTDAHVAAELQRLFPNPLALRELATKDAAAPRGPGSNQVSGEDHTAVFRAPERRDDELASASHGAARPPSEGRHDRSRVVVATDELTAAFRPPPQATAGSTAVRCTVDAQLYVGPLGALHVGRYLDHEDAGRTVTLRALRPQSALAGATADWQNVPSHPRLVKVLGVARQGDDHYLASEYAPGVSLYELIAALRERGESLSIPAATRLILEALKSAGVAQRLLRQAGASQYTRTFQADAIWIAAYGDVLVSEAGWAPILGDSRKANSEAEDRMRDVLAAATDLVQLVTGAPVTLDTESHLIALPPALAGLLRRALRSPDNFDGPAGLASELEELPPSLLGSDSLVAIELQHVAKALLEQRTRLLEQPAGDSRPRHPDDAATTAREPRPASALEKRGTAGAVGPLEEPAEDDPTRVFHREAKQLAPAGGAGEATAEAPSEGRPTHELGAPSPRLTAPNMDEVTLPEGLQRLRRAKAHRRSARLWLLLAAAALIASAAFLFYRTVGGAPRIMSATAQGR